MGEETILARLQAVLDTVVDGIIIIDMRGNIETFNQSAERIFGYAAAEVIGQNINMLMPEPYHSQHDGYLERYHTTGEAHILDGILELLGRRKNGGTFPMELAVSKIALGHEPHFTGIVRDISVRKQAELQQAKSRKELADFKAALDEHAIVATTDADGFITYANDKFCSISKYAREELLGQNHRIINSLHHPKVFFTEMWETISNGHIWKNEIKNRAKDGSFYWVDTTIIPLLGENGQPVQYIAIRADITARKQAEQALVSARDMADAANRAKDSFLATMSHEIRTPLGGMMGMLELLGYTPLNDDQRETLQAARDSGQSLLRIVNDILDWSKIEAGQLGISPQATSLTQLVTGVVNTYARVASANSLILEQYVDTRLSSAHIVDPLRLGQVLNNFVSNALKFTRKGGVKVRAELLCLQDGVERVRFSVTDTGAGIDKEVQKRLFQNYSQESADTARMYGGTGLGLAICRKLADLLDGQIDLETAPGLGSTFSITLDLPVTVTAAIQMLESPSVIEIPIHALEQSVVKADAPTVLVVDDHPVNRKLLVIQLGLLGLRGEPAENGEKALAMWRNGQFDLIITDCHMPKMDGYELAQTIRKIELDHVRPRTPIFAWTANALAGELERCRSVGMDEMLVKPANLLILQETLSRWGLGATASVRAGHEESDDVVSIIDLKVLDELSDNPVVKAEVLLDFMAQTRSDCADLQVALEAHDLPASQRLAHRMKGASRMVGAHELASACEAIEQAARQGHLECKDTVNMALQRLEAYLLKKDGTIKEETDIG